MKLPWWLTADTDIHEWTQLMIALGVWYILFTLATDSMLKFVAAVGSFGLILLVILECFSIVAKARTASKGPVPKDGDSKARWSSEHHP